MKIAYALTHPIQCQALMIGHLLASGVDVEVVYATDITAKGFQDAGFGARVQWDVPLMEGYLSEVLFPDSPLPAGFQKLRPAPRGAEWGYRENEGGCGVGARLGEFIPAGGAACGVEKSEARFDAWRNLPRLRAWWGAAARGACVVSQDAVSRCVAFFGDLSYPYYLFHVPVFMWLASRGWRSPFVMLLFAMAVSVAAYWILDRYSQKRHLRA